MFILLIYLATYGTSSGMATTAAEYSSEQSCLQAADEVKKEFKGFATQVRTVCTKK